MELHSKKLDNGILIIAFSGKYPDGGAGNPIAKWMVEESSQFIQLHEPLGIVVDLRQLVYAWGDMIECIYAIGNESKPRIPQATIVSENNRRALSTMEWGIDTTQDIAELDDVFDSMDQAVRYVEAQLQAFE